MHILKQTLFKIWRNPMLPGCWPLCVRQSRASIKWARLTVHHWLWISKHKQHARWCACKANVHAYKCGCTTPQSDTFCVLAVAEWKLAVVHTSAESVLALGQALFKAWEACHTGGRKY